MRRLADLLQRTGAVLCLSTTWRSSPELLAELWTVLVDAGAAPDIFVATTPHVSYFKRAREVRTWVDARRAEGWVGPWAALDDLDLSELGERFVWVDPSRGLQDTHCDAAAALLQKMPAVAGDAT